MPHHDAHYKQLFSHPRMVMALLRGFVPQAWVAHIDATALTQLPASYLSDRGEQRHSDRVWRIPLRRHPQDLEQWSLALLDAPDIGSVFAHTRFALEKEKAAEAALPAGKPAS